MKTRNENEIMDLGQYFGVPSVDDKISWLEKWNSLTEALKNHLQPESDKLDEILRAVQRRGDNAACVARLVEDISDAMAGADPTAAEDVSKALLITHEPDAFGLLAGKSYAGVNTFNGPVETMQGTQDSTVGAGMPYSVRETINVVDPDAPINRQPTAIPTRAEPSLAVIQIPNAKKTVASEATGAVQLFMNAIPTLEFSRCIPYLDVTLIQGLSAIDDDKRLQSVGLVHSLRGRVLLEDDQSPDFLMATAVDLNVLQALQEEQLAKEGITGGLEVPKTGLKNFSTAGMEMFCSPQMLAPPNATDGVRPVSTIDRFRPLAGINSFDFSAQPSVAFIAVMRGNIKLTCYDRSRLWELAPLVKPAIHSGKTRLFIEFGWSHPDGRWTMDNAAAANRYNAFGKFLDSVRVKMVFIATNCTYQFNPNGTVTINLSLVTQGGAGMDSVAITDTVDVANRKESIVELVEMVSELRKKILGKSGSTGGASLNEKSFLNSAAATSTALSMDKETKRHLRKFLRSKSAKGDFLELQLRLKELYGEKGNKGLAGELKETIAASISDRLESIRKTPDPFLRDITSTYITVDRSESAKKRKYVSLGKLMLQFIGQPLAASRKYNEIQLIYYSLNPKASFVREFNLAQFPIPIEDFETKIKKFSQSGMAIPLTRFLGFLRKEYLSNPTAHAFGMRKLYDIDDDGFELKEKFAENTILANEQRKRLDEAYDCGEDCAPEDLEFKVPRIQFQMEALPLQSTTSEEGKEENAGKSVLRIHVYDAQNITNIAEAEMLRAAFDNEMGLIGKPAAGVANDGGALDPEHVKNFAEGIKKALDQGIIEPVDSTFNTNVGPLELIKTRWKIKGGFAQLKRYISFGVPNIVYGSNNTAVFEASLSTENNALLSTISLQRSKKRSPTSAMGVMEAGMPMQLMPLKLQMSTFGCPLINIGQQFFIDLQTGTSADNIYRVSSVAHNMQQGEFKTNIEFINMEAYGVFRSATQSIEDALTAIANLDKEAEELPESGGDTQTLPGFEAF